MIIDETGFISMKFTIGSVVQEPIVLELTSVETGEKTSLEIDEIFITKNNGVLEFSFFRTTQLGPYTYRLICNNEEKSNGKIDFIQVLNRPTNDGQIERGKHT